MKGMTSGWKGDGCNSFSVKSPHDIMSNNIGEDYLKPLKWVKFVPLKVNYFVWQLFKNKIPTSLNMIKRGVQISSFVCPFYHFNNECTDHVLFSSSSFASVLWRWMIDRSSCLQVQPFSCDELLDLLTQMLEVKDCKI